MRIRILKDYQGYRSGSIINVFDDIYKRLIKLGVAESAPLVVPETKSLDEPVRNKRVGRPPMKKGVV
jgi:hypothetical protein